MYIVNIIVNPDLPADKHEAMFAEHTEWFKKHFAAGHFVMLGPYTDTEEHAGVIFAQTENREQLQQILEEDVYYPEFASYEVREFAPKLIATGIAALAGK